MAQRVRRNSEWADAFFPSTDTFWRSRTTQGEEVVHSGLAPIYPSLPYDRYDGDAAPWSNPVRLENPWDTSDYGDYGGPIPKPSDGELDRLFYGERLQQHTFMGLRSWQAGVLSREIYDGNISLVRDKDPVEAWESFQKQMITVDESMWPNFWRKERWFDLRVNPLDSIKNPHSDWRTARPLYWSVDNPIIWSHLRVAIELAFRQLCALICSDSPWFDALVFVDAQPWLHKRDGTATKFDTGFTGDSEFRE
ncbi:hypothetical protein F4778DRAFT_409096 [Xylariomycetidae sp. FL2044]|nr:hypothetical protein F4778DRAFT_409096 [Xylariomycetidae sp. FL2044]